MKTTTKLLLLIWAWLLWLTLQPAHAFYDPAAQRWLNRDPLGEPGFAQTTTRTRAPAPPSAVEQTTGVNLYAYVRNDPANESDPTGLAGFVSVHCVLQKVRFLSCTYNCVFREFFHIPKTGPTITPTDGPVDVPSFCGLNCLLSPWFNFIWFYP